MALKAVVTSLDGIDEALRSLYKQDEAGRHVLQVEGIDEMPAVEGLRRKNGELLREKQSLADKLDALGDVTPEQITEWKKGSKGTGKEAERIQELEQKLEQQSQVAQKEIQAAKEEAEEAVKAAEDYFLDSEIARAAQKHRASATILGPEIRKHAKPKTTESGKFEVRVLGPDGQPRLKDSQGNPYTLEDLVASYKEHPEYKVAFDARQGSDTPPGGGGDGRSVTPGTFDRADPMAWGKNADAVVKGEASAV